MCEIDITNLVTNTDTWSFSGSIATHGPNAGPNTWRAACDEAMSSPLLASEDELDAMRQWMKETGAWDEAERAAYTDTQLNALFIQLVSGDMREMGLDECELEDFDWQAWEERHDGGGNLYQGSDGRLYYCLGS